MYRTTSRARPFAHRQRQHLQLVAARRASCCWGRNDRQPPQPAAHCRLVLQLPPQLRRSHVGDRAEARRRFFTMPRTFRSSMPTVWNRPVMSVVSLCSASDRIAAMRACQFGQCRLGSSDWPIPLLAAQAERACASAQQCLVGLWARDHLSRRGVASADTQDRHPQRLGLAGGGCELSGMSTQMLTNRRSATRLTVADMILPVKRSVSRMRTPTRVGDAHA